MIFKSKIGWLFRIITFGTTLLLIATIGVRIYQNQFIKEDLIGVIISLIVIPLLFSIYFNTKYELSKDTLSYKCGPFKGEIRVQDIVKIDLDKKLWAGVRYATSMNGMVIYVGKFEEVFISPADKEGFIKALLAFNDKIEIISRKK